MTEHPTKQELNEYRQRVLAPAAFLSVHRHVTACPLCAAQSNSPQTLSRDLDDLHSALLTADDDTPYHLSATEIAAYAQGTLDEIDLEIADSHLDICTTCRNEVQRLKAPFKSIRLPLANRWQPWRVTAVVFCGAVLIFLMLWLLLRTKPVEQNEQVANPSPQSSPSPAEQGSLDRPADQVSPEAEFALVLNDGNQKVTVDKQGRLAGLEQLPSPIQQKVRTALQTGKLEQSSDLAQLAGRSSPLLGESRNGLPFQLIGPLGQMVRSEQPTFRWRALPGAQSYTVTVTDADLNEVATSPPLKTTQWRITKPLKQSGIYSWQVTALKDGVTITSPVLPAPQAKFKVIDRSTSEILEQAQRAYPNSHLTLGVLYAEAGILDEAERELQGLLFTNHRAGIALKLLQNVKAMRAAQTSSPGRR